GRALLALYESALPHVYGYLVARCSGVALAEDLTAETFLAAVDAVRRDDPPPVSTQWLIGVARHKLADHWRRQAREERHLASLAAPLHALRRPPRPVAPAPAFATRLRARITRALALPKRVTVSNLTIDLESEAGVAAAPAGGVIPYLIVADAPRALDWYVEALGARHRGEPVVMP